MSDFGVIPVLKPTGITSFKAVHILRKITGVKKIGHTGTLDPFASGLLPICIGKATRIANRITGKNKEYKVKLQFGIRTDTGDTTGKVIAERTYEPILENEIAKLIEKVLAIRTQKPPKFSAIKVQGKRAYELARKNQEVDLPERAIEILDFEILNYEFPMLQYRVKVSKGTYIRSLSETIAEMLGTVGSTIDLERTMIEGFESAKPVELESINSDNWRDLLIPVPAFFPDTPLVFISEVENYRNGGKIALDFENNEEVMVFNGDDFLGFGKIENSELQPTKVFI
jgi:tRNA pseudouridine55 synthase